MKKNILIKIAIFNLLLSVISFTEQFTIQDATRLALLNNRSIKVSMLQLEQNKISVDKAWKNSYFNISYNASSSRFFDDIYGNKESYGHSLALTQPLFTGGAITAGKNIAKENLKLSELNLDKIRKDVILNTIQAYINVYNAQSLLDVYKLSRDTLSENLKIQTERYRLNMITRPEYLESERSLADIEATIISQEAELEIAKENLGILIGVDGSNIEIVPFGVNDKFTTLVNLDEDLEKLKYRNTEYLISLQNEVLAKENIKLEESDLYPQISGVVSYGTLTNTGSTTVPRFSDLKESDSYNGYVGVQFSWKLFDWGQRRDDVKIAKNNLEISKIQSEQMLDDLKVSLKNIFYQIKSLEKSLESLQKAVEVSEENYKLEKERYEYRLITLNDLLRAETNLRQSRVNYNLSRLNYYYLVSKYGSLLD